MSKLLLFLTLVLLFAACTDPKTQPKPSDEKVERDLIYDTSSIQGERNIVLTESPIVIKHYNNVTYTNGNISTHQTIAFYKDSIVFDPKAQYRVVLLGRWVSDNCFIVEEGQPLEIVTVSKNYKYCVIRGACTNSKPVMYYEEDSKWVTN